MSTTDTGIGYGLVLAVFVQILDGLSALLAIDRIGIHGELNPFAVWMYNIGGLPMVFFPKIAGVILMVLFLIWLRRRNEELATMGTLAMFLAGLLGVWLNSLSILIG